METVWDEIRTILDDLIEVVYLIRDPSVKQPNILVITYIKKRLKYLGGKVFAEEKPNYRQLIVKTKEAQKKIARFKKKKIPIDALLLDAVHVMKELTIMQLSVMLREKKMNDRKRNNNKLFDIWNLENSAKFGLEKATILVTSDMSLLCAWKGQGTEGFSKMYKNQKGAKRGFNRRYNKAGKGKEKVKPEWLSIAKQLRKIVPDRAGEVFESLKPIPKEANHV